jgi:hypothetical protein
MCPQASPNGLPIIPQVKYAWQHQADGFLYQDDPTQNAWYNVIPTTDDVRLILVSEFVFVVNETLELRITVDGNVLIGSVAAIFGTIYEATLSVSQANVLNVDNSGNAENKAFLLEGHSVRVEARKTTAVGTGHLVCIVKWAKLLPT